MAKRITVLGRKFVVTTDKLLLIDAMRSLQGRFWGITGIYALILGLSICYVILPENLNASAAFSDFALDTRTSPYFTASILFAAYGMWRWRNYLVSTFQKPGLITLLLTFTMLGMYIVAFAPLGWNDTVFIIHSAGFALVGTSMALTVISDLLFRKITSTTHLRAWQLIRLLSVSLIVSGGFLTAFSTRLYDVFSLTLVGETLLLLGYFIWIIVKTYQGEGSQSSISRAASKVISIAE